ncbi:MAG: thiamine diphosphokinase [Pseudomonadota bacterium]
MTLLGAAPTHFRHVKQALNLAPILVAADGGADTALAGGVVPDAVIGDTDSLSEAAERAIAPAQRHHIAEQDSTDFDKCLRSIDAPAILAVGFTGGRLDHQLAACASLVRFPEKRVFMISEEDVCFLCPRDLTLELPFGTRFSLFPMGEARGTSVGLAYPIDGLVLSPSGQVGTSNEVTGPVRLQLETHNVLAIVPRACLEVLLDALT